jgi:hypothetical protein
MVCSFTCCKGSGCWTPILELRSRKNGNITCLTFKTLAYCNEHKKTSVLADFLSDEGFVKIVKHMRENGKVAPVQRCTTLTWKMLSETELAQLAPAVEAAKPPEDDSLPF